MIEKENYIQFKNLTKDAEIVHLFTKKPFNFNGKKMDNNKIISQYEEIEKITNTKCQKIIKPFQTHTNIVRKIDNTNINEKFENVDGLITNLRKVALVTSLADCQGILLYDKNKKVIGNIHSGWNGTLHRIIYNAITLMIKEYNCDVKDIEAYICPSILHCCFEVDNDVKEKFENEFSDIKINNYITLGEIKENKQKYYIDTVSINIDIMKKIGLLEQNIFSSNICTKCNKEIYNSHRGEPNIDGRNIAVIALK